ncbi:MAG: ASCH domain-containing protein [Oscillospiraceae bacterium]|nr:ASCH domain-containing protein [Oscillospiraceae bacterium]
MITLPIKCLWFDKIKSGEKREEYRSNNPHYDSLFRKHEEKQIAVMFRNGYNSNAPSVICDVIPHRQRTGRPEWGAEPGVLYWSLEILNVNIIEKAKEK